MKKKSTKQMWKKIYESMKWDLNGKSWMITKQDYSPSESVAKSDIQR